MGWPEVLLASGHRLVDNGVGDYDLECPDGVRRFVHFGIVARISLEGGPCPFCWTPLKPFDISLAPIHDLG